MAAKRKSTKRKYPAKAKVDVTILSALKGRASTPHDVTFLLPALLVRARSTGQPPTSSASSLLSFVGGLVIATDKEQSIPSNGIGQAPDPALKGQVCPLSIKGLSKEFGIKPTRRDIRAFLNA